MFPFLPLTFFFFPGMFLDATSDILLLLHLIYVVAHGPVVPFFYKRTLILLAHPDLTNKQTPSLTTLDFTLPVHDTPCNVHV